MQFNHPSFHLNHYQASYNHSSISALPLVLPPEIPHLRTAQAALRSRAPLEHPTPHTVSAAEPRLLWGKLIGAAFIWDLIAIISKSPAMHSWLALLYNRSAQHLYHCRLCTNPNVDLPLHFTFTCETRPQDTLTCLFGAATPEQPRDISTFSGRELWPHTEVTYDM